MFLLKKYVVKKSFPEPNILKHIPGSVLIIYFTPKHCYIKPPLDLKRDISFKEEIMQLSKTCRIDTAV